MKKILNWIFPFCELFHKNAKVNKKIAKINTSEHTFEYAIEDPNIEYAVQKDLLNDTIDTKNSLENKSKSSLFAITITTSIAFGIIGLLQDSQSMNIGIKISSIILSILSLMYMVSAGLLSAVNLTELNTISKPFPEDYLKDESEQKIILSESIEYNYLNNIKRNNVMSASYRCIINSIAIFLLIFLLSSINILISTSSQNNKLEKIEENITALNSQNNNLSADLILLSEKLSEINETTNEVSIQSSEFSQDISNLKQEIALLYDLVDKLDDVSKSD